MSEAQASGQEPLAEALTRRELDVLVLLAARLSDREIAERLTLAISSVKWYTRQIYEKLGVGDRRDAVGRAGELGLLAGPEAKVSVASAAAAGLTRPSPVAPAPLIGREAEIAALERLLLAPECRLVTLSGPGGTGKSVLALHLQHLLHDRFAAGTHFVALEALPGALSLPIAIADAVGLSLRGQAEPRVQLLDYLREANPAQLLVLDNFEHLMDGAGLLIEMLDAAPATRLLVTSRETLNLGAEWLYALKGLDYPEEADSAGPRPEQRWEQAEACPSVQLFVDSARHVNREFAFAGEAADVIRICRLTEGTPLAIKLAARWTKTLDCSVIADEIERNLDFLAVRLRDVPSRHRSMRAVFDHSWRLLGETERAVFRKLSAFRGGFRRTAASELANASLATLAVLVDHSLLQVEPGGRYHMHELLRQFAAERLAESPDEAAAVHTAHCAYYARFLHERLYTVSFTAAGHCRAVAELQDEFGNIRAAWQWAVEQVRADDIERAAYVLYIYLDSRGRYAEGEEAFALAAHYLGDGRAEHHQALADVLSYQGALLLRLGRFAAAREVLMRSHAIFTTHGLAPKFNADPGAVLGIVACAEGDFAEAARWGEDTRRVNTAAGDTGNLVYSLYTLTSAALGLGQYEAAQRYAEQAYALAESISYEWFLAYILIQMGDIARASGRNAEARARFEASYAIRKAFGDPEGMAVALNHLGDVAVQQGNFAEAAELYGRSLPIYRQIGDRGGLVTALVGLGDVESAAGDFSAARLHLCEGLQIAAEMESAPLILTCLSKIGGMLVEMGFEERGRRILAFVERPLAGEREEQGTRPLAGTPKTAPFFSDLAAFASAVKADLAALAP